MGLIIFDFIRRWKLPILGAFLLNVLLIFSSEKTGSRVFFIASFPWLVAPLLFADLNRGMARILRALPVSRQRAGESLWLIGVLLPTLLACTAMVVGIILSSGVHPVRMGPALSPTLFAVITLGLSGMLFLSMHGMSARGRLSLPVRVVSSLLWGSVFGGCAILAERTPSVWGEVTPAWCAAIAAGVLMAGGSVFLARALLDARLTRLQQGGSRSGRQPAPERRRTLVPQGIPAVLWQSFTLSLGIILCTGGGFLLYAWQLGMLKDSGGGLEILRFRPLLFLLMMSTVIGYMIPASQWMNALRALRSLPLPSWKLSMTLLGFPLAGCLAGGVACCLLWAFHPEPELPSILGRGIVLFAAFGFLWESTSLRWGLRRAILGGIVVLDVAIALAFFIHASDSGLFLSFTWSQCILAAVVVGVIAFLWNQRILLSNSRLYQGKGMEVGGR